MSAHPLLRDVAVGLAAGYAATKVTERCQKTLWRLTPASARDAEEAVRPAPSAQMAARRTAEWCRIDADRGQLRLLSRCIHYGLGVAWGPLYGLLRRYSGASRLGAGLLTGASMSLLVDEVLNPALGFSAPDRAYPASAHIRGLITHLLYGLAVAGAAEGLYRFHHRIQRRKR